MSTFCYATETFDVVGTIIFVDVLYLFVLEFCCDVLVIGLVLA